MAVVVLYGHRFQQPLLNVCLIGLLQAVRLVRIWPNTAAIGLGRSDIVLTNNISRLVGLALGFWAGMRGLGIPGVVGGLAIGELAALITALLQLNRAVGAPMLHDMDRFSLLILEGVALIAGAEGWQRHNIPLVVASAAAIVVVAGWAAMRETDVVAEATASARRYLERLRRPPPVAISRQKP